MQGHIWSETILNSEHLFYNILPRMIAVAERAWHAPAWQQQTGSDSISTKQEIEDDWISFSKALGQKELAQLDRMNIKYRVPPPGVRCVIKRMDTVLSLFTWALFHRENGPPDIFYT